MKNFIASFPRILLGNFGAKSRSFCETKSFGETSVKIGWDFDGTRELLGSGEEFENKLI